jgi:copper chaperone
MAPHLDPLSRLPNHEIVRVLAQRKSMDKANIANLPRESRVTETAKIGIAGMTCDECVEKVESALRSLSGVKEISIDRAAAVATVTFDNTAVDVPALHDALLKSGYKAASVPQR